LQECALRTLQSISKLTFPENNHFMIK